MSSRSVNDSSVRQNHRRPARAAGVPNFLLASFNADRYEFSRLVGDMAFDGDWHPAVEYLAIRHQNPDRHPRLQLRREGGACIPSGAFRQGSTTSSTPEPVGRISHVSQSTHGSRHRQGDGLAEESTYRFFLTLCLSCLTLSYRLAYTRRSYHERADPAWINFKFG